MVLGSIASFVAAVAGMYRLSRVCFGPLVGPGRGAAAPQPLLHREPRGQGYLDISYLALIIWAVVLEAERPRRGTPVFLLLAAAGLLRPDAWVMAGAYWLWCSWRADNRDPPSLPGPGGDRAARVGRHGRDRDRQPAVLADGDRRASPRNWNAPRAWRASIASLWEYGVRIDKLPVVLGALIGIPLAIWMAPRRALVPLAAFGVLRLRVPGQGAVGASVVDRYLIGAATMLLPFCAVSIGRLVDAGARIGAAPRVDSRRRGAGPVRHAGMSCATSASRVCAPRSPTTRNSTRAWPRRWPRRRWPSICARCHLLSLPDNKLIPDARWIQDTVGQKDIIARSQARSEAAKGSDAAAAAPAGAAPWRSTRSAARSSWRRSWTSATTRSTRSRCRAPVSSTRAATTRCMRTAESAGAAGGRAERRWAWAGLAVILAAGLGLRLWGVRQGLPYVYNIDEATHFVPKAVEMFQHGLDPHYFANPPAFTYLLHVMYAVWYGGGAGAQRAAELNPTELYTLARVASALLGTASLWLLYVTGARLFSRAAGLLAAAILAVAFLPVFYSHLAVNDVPTLAPVTLALLGAAGVLRRGSVLDYALAGAGLGLACASKYTAGIVILPVVAAAAARWRLSGALRRTRERRRADPRRGPRARRVPDREPVLADRLLQLPQRTRPPVQAVRRSPGQARRAAQRRPGLLPVDAHLGPGLAAGPGGAGRRDSHLAPRRARRVDARARTADLPRVHGAAGPLLRALAAADLPDPRPARGVLRAARSRAPAPGVCAAGRHGCALAGAAVLVAALLAQGLIYSVHSGLVLSRADTRALTRSWMAANIPAGSHIVAEPISPGPVGARRTRSAGPPALPLVQVPVPDLADHAVRRPVRDPAPGRDRGLRADPQPAAAGLLHRPRLLLGAHGLNRVRAGLRRPGGRAECRRLLPRARTRGTAGVLRLALPRGRGLGRRSASTGALTTTRWPIRGRGRGSRSTGCTAAAAPPERDPGRAGLS